MRIGIKISTLAEKFPFRKKGVNGSEELRVIRILDMGKINYELLIRRFWVKVETRHALSLPRTHKP